MSDGILTSNKKSNGQIFLLSICTFLLSLIVLIKQKVYIDTEKDCLKSSIDNSLSFVKYTMSMLDTNLTHFVVHILSIRFVYLFLKLKKEGEAEGEEDKTKDHMIIF